MWNLFEKLLRRGDPAESFNAAMLADLDGRYLEYLSRSKVRTLAAELGIGEDTSTTTTYTAGISSAANVKTESTREANREWPVDLVEAVSSKLLDRGRVSTLPDATERYVAARCYMSGGTLGAMDLRPPAAWFIGVSSSTLILLCGSASNLRDRGRSDEYPTWYPSRLDDLSAVIRSIVKSDEEGGEGREPVYLAEPGKSHLNTVESVLRVIDERSSGHYFLENEWVDFIAQKHFVLPAFELSNGSFSQVLLGSPLWVARFDGDPPAGWYPDPTMSQIPGTARWWDGKQWTDLSYTNGTALTTPPPPAGVRPQGRTPEARGIWRPWT